jgi:chitodextrinase
MAHLRFGGRDNPALPLYLNPNIFFRNSPDPGDNSSVIIQVNKKIYVWCSVQNDGAAPVVGAQVKFYVADPSTVPTPANSTLVGISNVSLDVGEVKDVLCVSSWKPTWINGGHECAICEISAPSDPSPSIPTVPWDIHDRHIAQHNLQVLQPASPGMGAMLKFATTGPECTPDDTPAPEWQRNVDYARFDLVRYQGRLYQCLQGHHSSAEWYPSKAPALWVTPTPCGNTEWRVQTAYKVGSRVTYKGPTYECIQAHSSLEGWAPPLTPALWKQVDPNKPGEGPPGHPARPFVASFLAVGLHNNPEAKISVKPAADEALLPLLRNLGADETRHVNVTGKTAVGMVTQKAVGDPIPDIGLLQRELQLPNLAPDDQQGLHTLIEFPADSKDSAAAMFFAEQKDAKGRVVGGVAMLALGSPLQPAKTQLKSLAATSGLAASIPYRPYSSDIASGFMLPDGIFIAKLGLQSINVETHNDGPFQRGISMYIEGFSDPNIVVSFTEVSPSNGSLRQDEFFKAVFTADFTKAATGETLVSFILQQQQGSKSVKVRLIKKIFVLGIEFDGNKKNFNTTLPQGIFTTHVKTGIIASKDCKCDDPGPISTCCPCCRTGGGGKMGQVTTTALAKQAWMQLNPSPPYPGEHGPLPFNDPWWKVVLAIIGAALIGAGAIDGLSSGSEVNVSVGGVFDESSKTATCCNQVQASAPSSNAKRANWLLRAGGAILTIAIASDDADFFDRGQAATVPKDGELTVAEYAEYDFDMTESPSPGRPYKGEVSWSYKRALDSGRVLEYKTKNGFENIHVLDSYAIDVDSTHHDDGLYTHDQRKTLYISAKFKRLSEPAPKALPTGEFPEPPSHSSAYLSGAELYVFAVLLSDRSGREIMQEMRDDGRFNDEKPNTGEYVTALEMLGYETGNWYLYVYAQDTNTTLEGTEPRTAARKIGGMLVTTQLEFHLDGKPCRLNHDAVITVV